ncbi:endonuclease/exonuclease/phosphatase family protein [Brenneria corticis]|uniref:Endonuclease/exonuclease/phosphatase family protein n=1 Tax=Brenneria corticis TaxID=2173106 RepID=A0A2U1TPD4_9GAMM|nr:endonuclease/exonuclease/phosphatase family protein [Brenneria sp. CFCC 11842]PWC11263.1 endonuclease/exonuclease/phosphatase family protein [Brenneria sp. CFCC 11842]
MRKKTYAMRYVAGQPAERIFSPGTMHHLEQVLPSGPLLLEKDVLRVMVWNIFKQQRMNWLSVLQDFGRDAQLVLLQEAQSSPELIRFATSNYLSTDQVPAIILPQHPSGVMTLSAAQPMYCCPLREKEPLLRLSKSALVTVYSLPDGRQLMVINIHAVNFSFGVEVYSKQLETIGEQLIHHHGPVVMAGDFNAWSQPRIRALYRFATRMALQEVGFIDDYRRRVFGRPLDFVFYRDLTVVQSSILVTQASDHNPLLVEFQLNSWK